MKILVIRNAWRHQDFGGAEELALSLVSTLNALGVETKLLSGGEALLNRARSLSVPYIKGPFSKRQILTKHRAVFLLKYLFDLCRARSQYIKIFKTEAPSVIHCTGQQDSIAATSAARKLNIPVIWSDHGELKNSIGFKLLPPWGIPGILLKKQMRHIYAIFMVNSADIAFVRKVCPESIIKVVPNGVVDCYDKNKKRGNDLVFASRIIREKGIFELLNAFELLSINYPDLRLIIAGEGPSLDEVKAFVAKNPTLKISFAEYSDTFIQTAGVFVLPTYTEAQSLALLKAMMFQVPIVTTRIDGNLHFLKDSENALLVEPKNSKHLAKALSELLDDTLLQKKIREHARKDYKNKYSLTTIVKEYYLGTYESLVGKESH